MNIQITGRDILGALYAAWFAVLGNLFLVWLTIKLINGIF